LPFNKNWTPGHEYMGTVAAGAGRRQFDRRRVTVEIHAAAAVQALPQACIRRA
jgi:L-iditol 2-dehydrogenase